MKDMQDIPEFVPNLETAATICGLSRTAVRRLRADTRFPVRTADGWPVLKIAAIADIHRLESMTDAEALAEITAHGRDVVRRVDAGEFDWLNDPACVARLRACAVDEAAGKYPDWRAEEIEGMEAFIRR